MSLKVQAGELGLDGATGDGGGGNGSSKGREEEKRSGSVSLARRVSTPCMLEDP